MIKIKGFATITRDKREKPKFKAGVILIEKVVSGTRVSFSLKHKATSSYDKQSDADQAARELFNEMKRIQPETIEGVTRASLPVKLFRAVDAKDYKELVNKEIDNMAKSSAWTGADISI